MNLRSGYPFWLIKNGLPYSYPRLTRSCKTDVIVLGGGISGALTAYTLNKAGVACTVVDARSIGLGSTCASTSLLQYEIDIPLIALSKKIGEANAAYAYHCCAEAVEQLIKLAASIEFEECKPKHSLYYAAWKKDLPWLQKECVARQKAGFDVHFLSTKNALAEFGFQTPGAILSTCGAEINAYTFTHTLLQRAIRQGAEVFDRTSVVKIDHQRNSVQITTTEGHTVKARYLVYATGYEVVDLIDKKIVDLQSTYACISEEADEDSPFWKNDALIWNTANPYLYMRTTTDRRILVGGRDEHFFSAGKRDCLINKKSKQLSHDFKRIFPEIRFVPEFSWAGTFGSTRDGLPYIGAYHKLPRSMFALGFGGNGITFSLIAAQLITAAGKKTTPRNSIFSFNR